MDCLLKWAKKWADWNDVTLDRKTMKRVMKITMRKKRQNGRVANELNEGANIRDIKNKPEIGLTGEEK